MTRTIFLAAVLSALASAALAQGYQYGTGSNSNSTYVDGYTTDRGTYVEPHYRTNPNSIESDNYGARGNYNPYNGRTGRGY